MSKEYIKTIVEFSTSGAKKPLVLYLPDGTKHTVDKVLSIKPRPSFKSGGLGERYEIKVADKIVYLFFEDNYWYLDT